MSMRDTDVERSVLRDMLSDIKFWGSKGRSIKVNDDDVTDSWVSDQLRRARHLWGFISARERSE
jgi:hypothetical protein